MFSLQYFGYVVLFWHFAGLFGITGVDVRMGGAISSPVPLSDNVF